MRIDWSPLDAALERRAPVLWWRDDDVTEPTPALDRLIALTSKIGAPLTLAAIPARVSPALAERIAGDKSVSVAVHGWAHANHAPASEKKAEFRAHRPLPHRRAEVERGLATIIDLFGAQALPVFIPPWNRIAPDMPETLAQGGYRALSVYGEREPVAGPLPRLDAHIDPIEWRGSRSAVDPVELIAHLCALMENDAPIGLMTHHLVHDEAVWELIERVAKRITAQGGRWVSLGSLIEATDPDPQ